MSSISSPPSLVALDPNSEDSQDSSSLELNSADYERKHTLTSQRGDYKSHTVTSHSVEDILSENCTYNTQETAFPDCRNPILSSIANSFDYNSRDSAGFSIQDILGLPQAYHSTSTQDEVEPRYDYHIANYDNISNSSNNYVTGVEEVSSEECIGKTEGLYNITTQTGSEVIYNSNYAVNDPAYAQPRNDFGGDIANEPGSGFSTQVMP